MRLLVDDGTVRHEVELLRAPSGATLADLVAEVTGSRPADDEAWFVDAVAHRAGHPLAGVRLLEAGVVARSPRPRPQAPQGWTARVSGGLSAGQVAAVPPQRPLVVGRSPQADLRLATPSASWRHVLVRRTRVDDAEVLRVVDDASTNGTLVDGVPVPRADEQPVAEEPSRGLRLRRRDAEEPAPVEPGVVVDAPSVLTAGGATVALDDSWAEHLAPAPGSLDNQTPAGTVPFNRPPRPGRRPGPEPLATPKPQTTSKPSRFSWISVLAPLAMAGAMVAVMGNARYAMIALLTPVMAVAGWFEQQQRSTKDAAAEQERFAEEVAALRTRLEKANTVERERLADELPDPATVLLRASLPTTRLWERRAGGDDFLALHAGMGDAIWNPPLDEPLGRLDERVRAVVDDWRVPSAPVAVDLTGAGVVGVVGEREGALAVARSLAVQAAVHCGPADLTIGVFCDPGRETGWEWASWLPHTRRLGTTGGDRWTSAERGHSEQLLRTIREGIDEWPTPAVLLVLDSDVLTEGRESVARSLLGLGRPVAGPSSMAQERPVQVSGIVVAPSVEQLPAACTVVVEVGTDARGTVTNPAQRRRVDDVVLAGLDVPTASAAARDLARFEDPELVVPGASLPSLVRLPPLVGVDRFTPETIRELWATSTGVSTPIGVGEHGVMGLDLVKDGPHGLVGGTTGSGKSEFLRSLVAGLAARNDPTKLNFLLIDFKGGAAFAACERLPHTIGTVSNLDAQLADRALRALEAEMTRRMTLFAQAGEGIDNLDAYLATNPAEPMPRLLLVVDEFAMLAKDYPDVLTALVSVAAVGRTLGVHMVLATQRPAGVVNDDILANTNLRVALRVQGKDDSSSVIGVPSAAAIGRAQQGRAFIKLGQDDITPVQTALVTGRADAEQDQGVQVREVVFGQRPAAAPTRRPAREASASDLDELIDAIVAANDELGLPTPLPVWPQALGEKVSLAGFTGDEPTVPVVGGLDGDSLQLGLADDPDGQRQVPATWDMDRGNVLLMGIPGSGTSTALATIALGLASRLSPDELDLMVLDMGSGDLAPLARLPHTVAYVPSGSSSREVQVRLLKLLRSELDARRAAGGGRRTVVLVDGLATLRDEFSDFEGLELLEGFYRAYADGPGLGLHFAVSTSRAKAVPSPMEDVTTQRWLFHLADPYDYSAAGLRPTDAPADVPGRAVLSETKLHVQVATPDAPLPVAVAQVAGQWGSAAKDVVVRQLPSEVAAADLGPARLDTEPWRIPVGIRESDLETAFLELYEGEHALVAGGARSGKSSLLLAMATALKASPEAPLVWGLCSRRSPLASAPLDRVAVGAEEVAGLVAALRLETRPLVLLVDDAETFDDPDQTLTGLVSQPPATVHVVAAGRADDLRSLYSHWTKTVRKSRAGVLLQPNPDYDGDLLGAALPRRTPVQMTVGRGFCCCAGQVSLVQAAR